VGDILGRLVPKLGAAGEARPERVYDVLVARCLARHTNLQKLYAATNVDTRKDAAQSRASRRLP
jgi:hypothetical protein